MYIRTVLLISDLSGDGCWRTPVLVWVDSTSLDDLCVQVDAVWEEFARNRLS